jgi:hypothetical protein
MSDQLTAFERALLSQLEALAKGSEASLKASTATSKQLQDLSNLLTSKTTRLERRVEGLEQRERSMIEALDAQTALTDQWREQSATLVTRVNTLLSELKK